MGPLLCPSMFCKLLFSFLFFASTVRCQDPPPMRIFQWKFTNDALSSDLPSCLSLDITLKPFDPNNDTHGIPPFYMNAIELNGTPRTTLIGTNESSLSWTVDHPVGTQLMLQVVDAIGSSGGVPPQTYTVINGQTTNCVVSGNNTDFTVSSNVTGTINTCEPWGLRIKGGAKPYNLTFAQINSPNVTNVTMGAGTDGYTYINRANPGSMLVAAVSDVTGRWAFGTPYIMPEGSSDTDCVGLVSTSGNATELDQQDQEARDAAARSKSRKRTAIAAGVTVPLVVLLIGGAVGFWWWRRRRGHAREIDMDPLDTVPKPYVDEPSGGQVLSINSFMGTSNSNPHTPKTPGTAGFSTMSDAASSLPYDPYTDSTAVSGARPGSGSSQERPGFANFPAASVRRPKKAAEAAMSRSEVGSADSSRLQNSGGVSVSAWPANSGASGSGNAIESPNGEFIIQHRDGGGVVRELPPPYADRGGSPSRLEP